MNRYVKVIMVFLCLSPLLRADTTLVGSDFLGTFDEYRKAIRWRCGIDLLNTVWMPDHTLDYFVKEAIATVNPMVMGRKVTDTIAPLRYQENTYAVDSHLVGIFSVSWLKYDSTKSLLAVPRSQWYQQEHKTTMGHSDGYLRRPSYYDYMDGYLAIHPAPTVVGDTLIVTGWSRVSNLSNSAYVSLIPQQYRPVILEYAAWKVAEARGLPMAVGFRANFFDLVARLDLMANGMKPGVKQ